jgi:hypothetical protein
METNKTQTEQLTQDAVMQSVLIKGLRINNYYELKGSVLGGGICQLKNLKDFIHIGDLIESDLVKPIPLTEEWLLKFGFQRFPWGLVKDGLLFKDDLKCSYLILQVGNGFERKIHYVHEFQNLYFALTQRELTVA